MRLRAGNDPKDLISMSAKANQSTLIVVQGDGDILERGEF
ncbi:hypothetical protein NB231_06935 [Nitrococcus mobilis Nb-231]|uniref:Uncharacterized protein n=1 Tax=Nitrococcus mobilis Nb-231 TaxID=314278 RepID=A4BUV3_9GAMM|nr:hypothetical protein NB231_06935 [Nitrococcus mobilis Nb-231]